MSKRHEIHKADIRDWCKTYDGEPFHAALCDPPYSINFMNRDWDSSNDAVAFQPETWAGIMEHLHPGAFLMAFGGSRTQHRMAVAIEDAGFILHSAMVYAFGSGFPKATRIDDQIDAAAGMEQEKLYLSPNRRPGHENGKSWKQSSPNSMSHHITAPATPLAATWQGHRYGRQAIKPAAEFICVAQKPYAGRPVDCITRTGAGALWIDGGRVGTSDDLNPNDYDDTRRTAPKFSGVLNGGKVGQYRTSPGAIPNGRWPSNLILSADAAERLDRMSGERPNGYRQNPSTNNTTWFGATDGSHTEGERGFDDQGGCSRFFHTVNDAIDEADPLYYCAKASTWERNAGLAGMPKVHAPKGNHQGRDMDNPKNHLGGLQSSKMQNHHPTLKPIELTTHLATLLLPPKEYAPRRILIPFCGVASELIGALLAGFDYAVGVERDDDGGYIDIAEARIRYWTGERITVSGRVSDYESMPLFAGVT